MSASKVRYTDFDLDDGVCADVSVGAGAPISFLLSAFLVCRMNKILQIKIADVIAKRTFLFLIILIIKTAVQMLF